MDLPLAKFTSGEARDAQGRWTGGSLAVPSVQRRLFQAGTRLLAQSPVVAQSGPAVDSGATGNGPQPDSNRVRDRAESPAIPERRSLIRSSLAARASKTLIPKSYTGSETPERPVDSWKELHVRWQIPKAIPRAGHDAIKQKLIAVVRREREGAIEKAKVTRLLVAVHGIKDRYTLKRRTGPLTLDPETPRGAANRAYNHAAMLALHDFGVVDYDFKMSDAQKAELTPLTRFMWHVRRRLTDEMNIATKPSAEAKAPYRAEFGVKFPKPKFNDDGTERVRTRPNDQFVKLAKAFDESEHPRDRGRFVSAGASADIKATSKAGDLVYRGADVNDDPIGKPRGITWVTRKKRMANWYASDAYQDMRRTIYGLQDTEAPGRAISAFKLDPARVVSSDSPVGKKIIERVARRSLPAGSRAEARSTAAAGMKMMHIRSGMFDGLGDAEARLMRRIGVDAITGYGNQIAVANPSALHLLARVLKKRADLPLAKASPTEISAAARSVQIPSPGQIEAGNYQKGHLTIGGLRIAIETPKGRYRRGVGPGGKRWSVKMPAHYGYFKGTVGADQDHVDVYLGPQAHEAEQLPVFVVDQVNARSGAFDEHKTMIGFPDRTAAMAAYDAAFSDGLGPKRRGAVCRMTWSEFRGWLRTGDTTKPLALSAAA
jgi:hypothetical protein